MKLTPLPLALGDRQAHWYDLGGSGPLVHFYHANANPLGTYGQLLAQLKENHRVVGLANRAVWQDSGTPRGRNLWQVVADDLVRFLEKRMAEPVMGIGHSMGAVATLLAAAKRPDLFTSLVLIDPVFIPRFVSVSCRFSPGILRRRIPIVAKALARPDRWASRKAAVAFHAGKPAFARYTPEALEDFARHGFTVNGSDQCRLAFPKQWEAHIYGSVPHIWRILPTVQRPVLAMRGGLSDVLLPASWDRWRQLRNGDTFAEFPEAGHMLPMEIPQTVASRILEWETKENR